MLNNDIININFREEKTVERLRAKASLTKDARLVKNMAKAILFKCPSKEELKSFYGFYKQRAFFKNGPLELEYFKNGNFNYLGTVEDIGTGKGHLVLSSFDETITIEVCDNIVFKYDFKKGILEFTNGEWIQLLEQSYEQLPDMIAKKNEETARKKYLESRKQRIADCSDYMMKCLINKSTVYHYIKRQLGMKGFSLPISNENDEEHMEIIYNGENVMRLKVSTDRGWAIYKEGFEGFVNGEWVDTFAAVIAAVKEKEVEIINEGINPCVEAAIMRLKPEKK